MRTPPRRWPHALTSGVAGAAVVGRTINAPGSVDVPHTLSYLPDVAAGLLTVAERAGADGDVWHLPVSEPLTTRQFADLLNTGTTPRRTPAPPQQGAEQWSP